MEQRKTIDGTSFTQGDYAIAVRWLNRLEEDPEQRTFELIGDSNQFVVNSTELRLTKIEMERVRVAGAPVRVSARASTRAQQRVDRPVKYNLPAATEQVILNSCW